MYTPKGGMYRRLWYPTHTPSLTSSPSLQSSPVRRSKKQQMQQRMKMAARKLLAEDKGERKRRVLGTQTEYRNEHEMTYLGVAWQRAAVVAVVGDIASPKPQDSRGLAKLG
jgi:hypothetical protein